jgi:hypothetical protein
LYGRRTWFSTLREIDRLRRFEKRKLRRMFGPEREEEAGSCMGPNKELRNLRYSSNTVKR